MEGISNEDIVNFFKEKNNDDLKNNFIGAFPSNYISKFVSFHRMMNEKKGRYPLTIMNADHDNKSGTHWWSFLNLHPKKEIFLFDSFGFEGFKQFIIQNGKKVLYKILFGIEKLKNLITRLCLSL